MKDPVTKPKYAKLPEQPETKVIYGEAVTKPPITVSYEYLKILI